MQQLATTSSNTASKAVSTLKSLPTPVPAPSGRSLLARFVRPAPPSIAQSRLKSSLFALLLFFVVRSVFTPYTQVRAGIIWLCDEYFQGRSGGQGSWAGTGVIAAEGLLGAAIAAQVLEAYLALTMPAPSPASIPMNGLKMTPTRMSSPLTRPYPSLPPSAPRSSNPYSTPTRSHPSQGTPSAGPANTPSANTPHRSSPLSSSTAKILNISVRPREATGLYFPEDVAASPSRMARASTGQAGVTSGSASGAYGAPSSAAGSGAAPGSTGGDFVMVEREEREWAENVWKGVRGKGARIGL